MQWKQLAQDAAFRAEKIRAQCGVHFTAPLDVIAIAEICGCEIRFMPLGSLDGVYSPKPRPVIVLGSERPAGRRAYNCAHELGHHVFKHGIRLEELNAQRYDKQKPAEEYLADMYAGFLLMSPGSVRRTLKDRGWQAETLTSQQAFRLASYFGVGYSAIVNHLKWSLGMMSEQYCENLLQVAPKQLKSEFGTMPQAELLVVDLWWKHRAVDMEIGDTLVLPRGVVVEDCAQLESDGTIDGQSRFVAAAKGYSRAFHETKDWAINIRVAARAYEGLARYRFYEDVEEDAV